MSNSNIATWNSHPPSADADCTGGNRWCLACGSAAATLFCRTEDAYLCIYCDSRANQSPPAARRHERLLVCSTCKRSPAAVICRADAAMPCTACDTDVHSAIPLARRHHRSPAQSFPPSDGGDIPMNRMSINPMTLNEGNDRDNDGLFLIEEEVDQYLDLDELDGLEADQQLRGSERSESIVVPVNRAMAEEQQHQHQNYQLEGSNYPLFGYSASNSNTVNENLQSHTSQMSLSSTEASIVPDATMNEISNVRLGTLSINRFVSCQLPFPMPQFSPRDREARVLRYKEKRKARKFEKTIRYASRKAYAEARPRIRGRFARRTDVETDAEKKLSSSAASRGSYGIVPSF